MLWATSYVRGRVLSDQSAGFIGQMPPPTPSTRTHCLGADTRRKQMETRPRHGHTSNENTPVLGKSFFRLNVDAAPEGNPSKESEEHGMLFNSLVCFQFLGLP